MLKPERHYLSTTEAARILGVSVATIKRWVDDGVLPAHRTAGGHRRLLLDDVQRLIKQGAFPVADLRRVALPAVNGRADSLGTLAERLREALLGGDGATVRAIVHGCHQRGQPLEAVADQVVAPALTWIGQDWQYGRIDVYQEHRATRLCEGVLFDLKADLEASVPTESPVAVGGAPEHDPTVIPSLLIQIVLLDNGWQAVNLGPHTPVAAFRRALHDLEPKLLWLSFTHPFDEDEGFLRTYRDLYAEAAERGAAVAVGGQGLRPELRAVMPYTAFGDGISQLGSLARSLHPPRRRPRRGRPAK